MNVNYAFDSFHYRRNRKYIWNVVLLLATLLINCFIVDALMH